MARSPRSRFAATVAAAVAVLLATVLLGSQPAAAVGPQQQQLTGFADLVPGQDGAGVIVAVLDTGVDLDHPALAGRLEQGWDFVDSDDSADDPNGHGTHVAGIVAGEPDAGGGGLAQGTTIMPVRVLDEDGNGDLTIIAEGIRWAANHGATVINLSLGDSGRLDRIRKSGPVAAAIREVSDRAVVVVSAGNDSQFEQIFRADVPALVVVAVDDQGQPAPFTNVGDVRAVAAPGVDVVSAAPAEPSTLFPSGTAGSATLSGTSMAAPFVSAAAAVLLQAGATPDDVPGLIQSTAQPHTDRRAGAGLLDIAAAVNELSTATATPGHASPSHSPTPAAPGQDESEPQAASWQFHTLAVIGIVALLLISVVGAVLAIRRR